MKRLNTLKRLAVNFDWLLVLIIVGALFAFSSKLQNLLQGLGDRRFEFYSTLAGVFGTLLGFTVAGIAIFLTMPMTPRIELLAQAGHYETVVASFTRAAWALASGLILVVTAMAIDTHKAPDGVLLFLILVASLLSTLRMTRGLLILDHVLRVVSRDHKAIK